MTTRPVVRAAGGIVWRRADPSPVQVLLVHRPRYDDWSFPKGKNEADEDDVVCALREVEEETGVVAAVGDELPSVSYVDAKQRTKHVRYWAMTVAEDRGFEPSHEVDERAWVGVPEAHDQLSYDHDRLVLEAFAASLATGA